MFFTPLLQGGAQSQAALALPLTSATGTGSTGSVTPSTVVALSGVAGTGSVGTVGTGSNVTAALTGVSGTGSVTSPGAATVVALSGVSGSGSVGSVTVASTNVTLALTGVTAIGAVGSVGAPVPPAPPVVPFSAPTSGTTGASASQNTGIAFPQYSAPVVDPKTGTATKDFFFFLQQLWHTGTGGAVRAVSVDDLQIQDELESAAGDTAGIADAIAIAALENLGALGDDVQVQSVSDELLSQLAQEQDATTDADAQALAYLHFDPEPTPRAQPVSGLTVGASPYAYKTSFDGSVIVNAGTVSLIEFSRDGSAFFTLGTTAGIVPLSRGDTLRTTYTVAPTMTFIPR